MVDRQGARNKKGRLSFTYEITEDQDKCRRERKGPILEGGSGPQHAHHRQAQ